MSDSSSESEDFVPTGFDPSKFLTKRPNSPALSVMSTPKQKQSDLPVNLQYETLLKRAHTTLNIYKKSDKKRVPIDIRRESSSKSSMNLVAIAESLNREPEHLMKFILCKLLTTGSIMNERLVVKGNFVKNDFMEAVSQYIDNFVACKGCGEIFDTVIVRENKLYFVRCRKCCSSRNISKEALMAERSN